MDFERMLKPLLCFLLTVSCFVAACTKDELIMIQLISRHGSSAPAELYPTDPNPPNIWKEGLGDLTMLGKFQPYALGSLLRARYDGFITSDPREIEVMSSAHSACVKSALSHVAALYAPNPHWEIVKNLAWQPIAVKYIPGQDDKHFETPACPEAEEEYERILASPEAQDFILQYQDLFDYWSIHSGWKVRNWDSAALLHDVLEVENDYNLTVPMWARRYWEELCFISDMSFHWNLKTRLMQRLRGGPLIELVVEKMKKKAAGAIDETKVLVYNTHGDNLAAFLTAMDLFNGKEPPFSATVVVELYKHLQDYYVRMMYLNSTTPEREPQLLHLLNLNGCSEFCPLDYIVDYTKDLIPKNWEQECELK